MGMAVQIEGKIMKTIALSALAATIALGAVAAPAMAATTVVNGKCVSVTDSHGCLFSGNINEQATGNNSYGAAETAYNVYNDTHPSAAPNIALSYLAKSDLGGFTGTVTGLGTTAGTWDLSGFLVNFIAVKAGSNFVIYQLATPTSSGSWSTADLGDKDLSHLEFFGTMAPVPEPATWAMLVLGMGIVGASMRRRQTAVSFA
jgi:hypothetical protein